MRLIRIALCQLEAHPALYLGTKAFLEEPFSPTSHTSSLAQLGTKGVDVSPLQQTCLERYLAWHELRITAILTNLEPLEPDVVLFPEGAIPWQLLPKIGEFSSLTGSTILAGTHTPQQTRSAQEAYKKIGLDTKALRQLFKYQSENVLPLLQKGRATFFPKNLPSPFEMSVTSSRSKPATPSLKPFSISVQSQSFEVLPVICSEALQLPVIRQDYDLVTLIACDHKPLQFKNFLATQVRNRKPVVFCNDGAAGGSLVSAISDERMSNWLHEALPDGLPPGDTILVIDLDLDVTAVEVGTAIPGISLTLVSLASVIGELDESHVDSTRQLSDIASLDQPSARASSLRELLRRGQLTRVQRVRVDYLAKQEERGLPTESLWSELGRDCIVPGLVSLRELEAQLSAACARALTPMLGSPVAQRPDVASSFMSFLAECNSRAGRRAGELVVPQVSHDFSVLDRDNEISLIHSFLDQPTLLLLEVTGLRGIGKSATLRKALSQSGISEVLKINLTETSSVDFLIYSILQRGGGQPIPPYEDPLIIAKGAAIRAAFRTIRVLIIENAHLFLDRGAWRDNSLPALLDTLLTSAEEEHAKVIIESRHELDLSLKHPALRKRLHLRGFTRELRKWGVALFDAQLRRVNLHPSVIGEREKGTIVDKLGGHPVAIALAADFSYEEGIEGLLLALKERRGFFLAFLEDLVRGLNLTDEQECVMRLLCLARAGVPRSVILESASFAASPSIRELVALGAVEVTSSGWIEISSVLREYFDPSEIAPEPTVTFHASAARTFAFLAREGGGAVEMAVEAEYHANLAGVDAGISTGLVDGAVATAQAFYSQQRYDEASTVLRPLLKGNRSRSLDILRLAAQVEAKRNNYDSALTFAQEVFQRNPRDTSLLAELAKTTFTQFQDQATEQLIAIARAAAVEDVGILITEGRLHLRRGKLDQAEKAFRRAKEITERNPWPFFYLGRTLLRAGELADAIDVLHQGEEFYYRIEGHGKAVINAIRTQLGLAYLLDGKLDLAALILESLISQDNPNPEAIRAFAALAIQRDGIKEAHQVLEKLQACGIRNRHDEAQFRLLYGLFYLGVGDLAKASAEFAKAHAADRTHVFVMMKWARTLFDLAVSRFAESDETYKSYVADCARLVRSILEFDPDNSEGLSLMQSLRNRFSLNI